MAGQNNVVLNSKQREKKVMYLTFFFVMGLFSISFLYDLIVYKNNKQIYISKNKELINNIYNLKLNTILNYKYELDEFLENSKFKKSIIDFDNENLKCMMDRKYDLLNKENRYFKNLIVTDKDNNLIYKAKINDTLNKNIQEIRLLPVLTNKTLKSFNGIEICKSGANYRLTKPIIYNDIHYGMIELGIDINLFVDEIEQITKDVKGLLFIENEELKKSDLKSININKEYSLISLDKEFDFSKINLKNDTYTIDKKDFYIYNNYTLKDINGKSNVKIVYLIDITDLNQDFFYKSLEKIVIFIVVGILIFIVFHYGFKYYRIELQKQYEQNLEKEKYINEKLISEVMKRVREVKQKDRIILEQSKLTILGEMISMLSHQWRQPLAIVKTSIDNFMISYMINGNISENDMIKIENDVIPKIEYMTKVINNFSDFFKPDDKKVSICPDSLVENGINILNEILEKYNINYEIDCNTNVQVKLYKNEYVQVLINIINNAIDKLSLLEKNDKKITFKSYRDNNKYVLLISDNGGPIDEDIKDKIFEPYFSTKCLNERGLGLYMSKMMIQRHLKGVLSAYNDNDNAVFKIELNIDITHNDN